MIIRHGKAWGTSRHVVSGKRNVTVITLERSPFKERVRDKTHWKRGSLTMVALQQLSGMRKNAPVIT
jgi:hypothetical protein